MSMASNEKADIDLILRRIYAVESDGWAPNLDNPKKSGSAVQWAQIL